MGSTNWESQEGRIYQGLIVDQLLSASKKDEARLILTVKVTGVLKNDKNPADGVEPCGPQECEVWITIPNDDVNRLRMALRDLERLGFADDDISRLHPDHPDFCSLVDEKVHVRCKSVNDLVYWNLCWPTTPLSMEQATQHSELLRQTIAKTRRDGQGTRNGKALAVKGGAK